MSKTQGFLAVCCVLALVYVLPGNVRAQDGTNIRVIANDSVASQTLSPAQLRNIFSKRQATWPDGQVITVFVLDNNSPLHEAMCKQLLGMFPYQIERQWKRLAFSGLGELPVTVGSEQEMVRMVKSTPGAIGYIGAQSIKDELSVIDVAKGPL